MTGKGVVVAAREQPDATVAELRKIAHLLAIQVVRDRTKSDAVVLLAQAGFSPAESAALLSTTDASVRAMLSQARGRASARQAADPSA